MKGREILATVRERATTDHCFVKWWRKEEDFLDYELLDRFLEHATESEEIGGLQLLTMNEMRDEVKRVGGTRVKFIHEASGDKIEWVHRAKEGVRTHICAYTPEALMTIFDVETHGNAVDS
ncbi:hypothetical protein F6V30_15285 [Oryzomonas sagensis]|uniref:Uncharacterized protein n=1 Tax=Oryzomonas sagensis TaxID=2603857 RepID=A0ABQ6TKT1_9BACT|nr:hypothetical protein [Oryzomonas sagensis]KAB0668700.1 hypothetical protein F6V30_15285 [Oryzomonas sagensis]